MSGEELRKKENFSRLVRHTLVGKAPKGTILVQLPVKRKYSSYSIVTEYEHSDLAKAELKKAKFKVKPEKAVVLVKPRLIVRPPSKQKGFFDPSKVRMKLKFRKVHKHSKFMDVDNLHDEEHYIVSLRTGGGCKTCIVSGYRLKSKQFHKRLARHVPLNRRHWTGQHFIEQTPRNLIEIMLPEDEKGRVLATDVIPWSMTTSGQKEKTSKEYAKLVQKISVV